MRQTPLFSIFLAMTAPGGKLAAVAAAASFPDLSRLGRAVASDPVVVLILSCNYEAHKPLGTAPRRTAPLYEDRRSIPLLFELQRKTTGFAAAFLRKRGGLV